MLEVACRRLSVQSVTAYRCFGFQVGAFVVVVHIGKSLGAELQVAVAANLHCAAAWVTVAVRGGPAANGHQRTGFMLDQRRRNGDDRMLNGVGVEKPRCGVGRDKRGEQTGE